MYHGIVNVYKEPGFTSHDVVAKLRGIYGQKKIGHTGTLDPDAEGVLPVCLGSATKVCDLLTDRSKTYVAVLLLGLTTDTQDASGKVLSSCDDIPPREAVEEAVYSFLGSYDQVPPMYSALKVNGKKLYELAREGKTVERKPRRITIFDIKILDIRLPEVEIEVSCSKGTYIRTLCEDIGNKLGCGACMKHLTRSRVGEFDLEESVRISQLQEAKEEGCLEKFLLPVDRLFLDYPALYVTEEGKHFLVNGNRLKASYFTSIPDANKDYFRVYMDKNRFYAIYENCREQGDFKLLKMFKDEA